MGSVIIICLAIFYILLKNSLHGFSVSNLAIEKYFKMNNKKTKIYLVVLGLIANNYSNNLFADQGKPGAALQTGHSKL